MDFKCEIKRFYASETIGKIDFCVTVRDVLPVCEHYDVRGERNTQTPSSDLVPDAFQAFPLSSSRPMTAPPVVVQRERPRCDDCLPSCANYASRKHRRDLIGLRPIKESSNV